MLEDDAVTDQNIIAQKAFVRIDDFALTIFSYSFQSGAVERIFAFLFLSEQQKILSAIPVETLLEKRYQKFRKIGKHETSS